MSPLAFTFKFTFMLVFVLIITTASSSALACGPWVCSPYACLSYGLNSADGVDELNTCAERPTTHLDPGNRTEINFAVLAWELSGQVGDYSGSIGSSASEQYSDGGATEHFESIIGQDKDAPELRTLYAKLDTGYLDDKKKLALKQEFEQAASKHGQGSLWTYLKAIMAFRFNDYDTAIAGFGAATKDPRTAEPAMYLIARSHLLKAQSKWDGYSYNQDPATRERQANVELEELKLAYAKFLEFTKTYPEAQWRVSAQGLKRRCLFLLGDVDNFLVEWNRELDLRLDARPRDYEAIKAHFRDFAKNPETLFARPHLHPALWLIRAYYKTRNYTADDSITESRDVPGQGKLIPADVENDLKALEADRGSFKKYPDLFAWTKAVYLLALNRGEEGYRILQQQAVAKTNKQSLSWIILNSRLLMQIKQFDQARSLVRDYLKSNTPAKKPEATPYADALRFYALTFAWQGNLKAAFEPQSIEILGSSQLERLATEGLTPSELFEVLNHNTLNGKVRTQIERVALAKQLVWSAWTEVARTWPLIQNDGIRKEFKVYVDAAAALAKNKTDAAALFRVGSFVSKIEPGPEVFAPCKKLRYEDDKIRSPMSYFGESLLAFSKGTDAKKNPIEAELLESMIRCYKPHYSAPYCFGAESAADSDATRRGWFKRLHKRFPGSPQAKRTPIFW